MHTFLLDQTRVFVYACVLGLGLGMLYDVLAAFPSRAGKRLIRPILDIFYCLVFMVCFIALIQLKANGEIRWYVPGGMAIGLMLYFLGFSDYVKLILSAISAALSAAARGVRRIGKVVFPAHGRKNEPILGIDKPPEKE